jgi:hypothetical protein
VSGNVAALPSGGGAAPWTSVAADLPMMRAGTIALPPEILLYDPASRSVTRSELAGGPVARLFGTATRPGAGPGEGLAVVGGKNAAGADEVSYESVVAADGTSGGTVGGHPRLGATVTALSPTEALVWGGDLTATPAAVRAGDRLSGLDGAPVLSAGPLGAGPNRAFHAATRFDTGVLVVGGLTVTAGAIADAAFAPFVQVVDRTALTPSIIDLPGAVATAYPAAVTLAGGDVLLSGGASIGVCASTLSCPSAQSIRIRRDDGGGGGPRPEATSSPGLARYGHRLTRLPDGTVLVTGGFSPAVTPDQIRAVRDAELFDPHGAADDPIADLGLARAAGDVARSTGGEPLAPCTLIGGGGGGGGGDGGGS